MVPNGWIKTDLNPFIDIKHGFAFKSEFFREEGNYVLLTPGSFYEPGGFRDQKSKTKYYVGDIPKGYLLSKGELLVAMTEQAAGLLGSTLFVPSHDRYLHNQRLGLIQIKDKNGICPEFLYLTYNSPYIRKQIAEQSTGTKVKHTSPDKLKSVICLLPSLPEQRKIAQILSTWDRGIATTEKLINASKQQKKALMQQLLTGKKRLVDPETGKAFEGDWEEVKLEFLTENTISNGIYKTAESYSDNGNSAVLDINCVYKNNIVSIKKARIANITNNEIKKYKLEFGDILINRVSLKPDGVGVAALFNIDSEKNYVYESNLMRIRLIKEKANSEFINFILSSEKSRSEILMKANIGAQTSINQKTVNSLAILLPKFKEQQKIASVLTAIDKDIELLEAKLAHLKQEKKALMQQLLTGKRRVSLSS
ncbi:restriction endonuclease subunit S [Photobacterium kishitanii]|uniref:restriction endonuclease subunit S n=1 Tax=Photobacterium kishitanii TaxID=318456 RepID=UPI0005D352B8|nr:restriction endonuclease subunit S [Photobacterium kishitanii]KJG05876.1 type I restriction modification protein subunit S [Photobacterium kishitanii]PSV06506.1 restriction endonuclease subunit S [Photobacterium kishitanii]PSV77389.1 restriction endonuclease subunit S [Photobacterium kishitanii]